MAIKSVATVTGASQGIGRATALRLARDFSVVVLVASNKDRLEATPLTSGPLEPRRLFRWKRTRRIT
jgi:NAD(P)-dependent dehydrogenase (short-subunit alcohol dehydrogenase family)